MRIKKYSALQQDKIYNEQHSEKADIQRSRKI